jgi:hypothetical protein
MHGLVATEAKKLGNASWSIDICYDGRQTRCAAESRRIAFRAGRTPTPPHGMVAEQKYITFAGFAPL